MHADTSGKVLPTQTQQTPDNLEEKCLPTYLFDPPTCIDGQGVVLAPHKAASWQGFTWTLSR